MIDQNRKAFEDFVRATPYYAGHTDEDDFLKRSPIVGVDEYVDATIEGAWMAWDAATQRAAEQAEYCREHFTVSNEKRSRFDIYDLNRTFKDACGIVRDQIKGAIKYKETEAAQL